MIPRLMIGFVCVVVIQASAFAQPKESPAKEPSPAATSKADRPTTFPSLPNAAVSIPWEELRQLIDRGAAEKAEKPPVDFVFSPATYNAEVTDKNAKITAETTVTLLRDGWVLVPIGPAEAGVTQVTADGEAAPAVMRDQTLYVLLSGGGKKKLVLTAERPTAADGGRTRIEQPLLPAALVTVTATIPGTSLDVQANGASSSQVVEEKEVTRVTASYRGGTTASIAWKQRPRQLKEADARVSAETQTLVMIEKGLMRSEARVLVTIERASIRSLQVSIDPKAVVLSVSGKDVGQWTEAAGNAAGAGRTVTVEFGGATEGERRIDIVYERDVPEDGGDVQISPVVVKGARRDRGMIAVATRGGYEVRPGESTAAERVSVSELPEWLRNSSRETAVQVGYRYAAAGANVALALEKEKQQEAKLFAQTSTRIAIERGVLRCRAEVSYEILHAGVDTLRIGLPAGAEVANVNGAGVRNSQIIEEKNNQRTLVVGLKDLAKDKYQLTIDYDIRFEEAAQGKEGKKPAKDPKPGDAKADPAGDVAVRAQPRVGLITNPDAAQDRGFVGIEIRGGYELTPQVEGAERVDVKELPEGLWKMARSPLTFGYRYDTRSATLTLSMARHQDLDVLVAMSDICEATTTFTPDGKSITKMMFVTRNNLKPFMTLKLPEGAQLWSAFVDDRPVTPSKSSAAGTVLVPLKKSEDVDEDDQESYKAKREERRKETGEQRLKMLQSRQARVEEQDSIRDLKPYDVEIVFVMPAIKFLERGDIKASLPQSDVPIGQLSWAIFLPKNMRVLEAQGNLSEVTKFTLPFRHFADAEVLRQQRDLLAKAQEQAQAAQQAAADAAQAMAEQAKAKGVLPVRIEIPIVGEIHRFEKFLTVDEAPQLSLLYSRKLTE